MATITATPPNVTPLPSRPILPANVLIKPSRGWLELNLRDVWDYRELLYFLVWRDVKVRYRQTVIGAAWVVPMHYGTFSENLENEFGSHMLGHRPEQKFKVFQCGEKWTVPED